MFCLNIFVLDEDVRKAAEYHCDKHVVKMVTESAQLLTSAHYFTKERTSTPYGLSHENHPCAVWTRESMENWYWLLSLGLALYGEYRYRYDNKTHNAGNVVLWCFKNPPKLESKGMTQHPLCMPDEYRRDNVVESYRAYYIGEKRHLFKWKNRDIPYWIKQEME